MNDSTGKRCQHFREEEMKIPERTRAPEKKFCSRSFWDKIKGFFSGQNLPPFVSGEVKLSLFTNKNNWKLLTEDTYLDGKHDLIYAMGPLIYASVGTNNSTFVPFYAGIWSTVYAPSPSEYNELHNVVALEVDSPEADWKANCDAAYQY